MSPEPSDHEELYMHLERDQLASERHRRLPPAQLGTAASIALWALRIFCVVVSVMVIYTFIAQLG
jgi:hypothetical protein